MRGVSPRVVILNAARYQPPPRQRGGYFIQKAFLYQYMPQHFSLFALIQKKVRSSVADNTALRGDTLTTELENVASPSCSKVLMPGFKRTSADKAAPIITNARKKLKRNTGVVSRGQEHWGFHLPDRGFRPNRAVLVLVGELAGEFSLICGVRRKGHFLKNWSRTMHASPGSDQGL